MFHRFPAYFDPFTSIWEILIKMKIDMKNVDFTRFSYKYLICGFNPEISTWKLLFQKVQMILYILPIYHFFISCILNELCSSENTCEIIRFGDKCFKIFTSELTKYTVDALILSWWNISNGKHDLSWRPNSWFQHHGWSSKCLFLERRFLGAQLYNRSRRIPNDHFTR